MNSGSVHRDKPVKISLFVLIAHILKYIFLIV